mmetsp:Transcript_50856/g.111366  ORF Transcript_50856/g.111366 Transcript_50856/m.111366 type:complete len:253 (-) Transcript_50856:698-1456(-)
MASWACSIFASSVLIALTETFSSSSALSSSCSQYVFFSSSSLCSLFKLLIIPLINLLTFSKPTFLPRSANDTSARYGDCRARLDFRASSACALISAAELSTCSNDSCDNVSVFLNSSVESSSFKTLIVSARAASSSCRVADSTSKSFSAFAHFSFSVRANCLSCSRVFSVSLRSSLVSTNETASSPTRPVFTSTAASAAAISFCLDDIISLYDEMASFSCLVTSARSACICSFICLRMPTICPLAGVYPDSP